MSYTVGFQGGATGPFVHDRGTAPPARADNPPPKWSPLDKIVREPPSAQQIAREQREAEEARIARMRPADKSVRAVQAAVDAIIAERAIADARLLARRDAEEGLSDGAYHAPEIIRDTINKLELAEFEARNLANMEASMRASLVAAEETELEELRDLADRAKAAEQVVGRFRSFIAKEYPKAAMTVQAGLALEREAESAMHVLRAASYRLPGYNTPEDLPRVVNGTAREAFRFRACLPGTDVRPQER